MKMQGEIKYVINTDLGAGNGSVFFVLWTGLLRRDQFLAEWSDPRDADVDGCPSYLHQTCLVFLSGDSLADFSSFFGGDVLLLSEVLRAAFGLFLVHPRISPWRRWGYSFPGESPRPLECSPRLAGKWFSRRSIGEHSIKDQWSCTKVPLGSYNRNAEKWGKQSRASTDLQEEILGFCFCMLGWSCCLCRDLQMPFMSGIDRS